MEISCTRRTAAIVSAPFVLVVAALALVLATMRVAPEAPQAPEVHASR